MEVKKLTLAFICLLSHALSPLLAQDGDLSEVNVSDFISDSISEEFKNPDALILMRNVENEVGNYIVVTERRLILSKDGLAYGTVNIPHPNITKITGTTYNLVDGNIEKTPLEKKIESGGETKKIRDIGIIVFSKVSVGSIIEYTYRATRGTFYNIPLQFNIPIKNIQVVIRNNSRYRYDVLQNPRAILNIRTKTLYESQYFTASNVPAFEDEPYTYDSNLFRSYLEISTTGSKKRNTFSTFDSYVEFITERDAFTNGYKPVGTYKDEVAARIKDVDKDIEKVKILYDYVKSHMEWDESYGILPSNESARFAFKKGKGDVADINLLLVSMLKSINLSASPVLVATRSRGIPLTPSDDVFNYVLASVEINGEVLILDAVSDKASFKYLPINVINWRGLRITENKTFDWIPLSFTTASETLVISSFKIDDDLILSGNIKTKYTGYKAMLLQESVKTVSETEIKKLDDFEDQGVVFSNLKRLVNDTINHSSSWSFDFEKEDAVQEIGDALYIKPLPLLSLETNPFQNEVRRLPIDFG